MRTQTVRFDTTRYENTHGRKPCGFGGWAFSPSLGEPGTVVFATGTFTEAKKVARRTFPRAYVLYVLP